MRNGPLPHREPAFETERWLLHRLRVLAGKLARHQAVVNAALAERRAVWNELRLRGVSQDRIAEASGVTRARVSTSTGEAVPSLPAKGG